MDTYEFKSPVVHEYFHPKQRNEGMLSSRQSKFFMVLLFVCMASFFVWSFKEWIG